MLFVPATVARLHGVIRAKRGDGVPAAQRAAYNAHIGTLIGETADLADQAGKDAQAFLQKAALDIVTQLGKVRPGSWTEARMGEIVEDIGHMAESLGVSLDSELAAAQAAFAERGATEVLSGIREADVRTSSGAALAQAVARFPGLDSVVVNALGGFRSDLITVLAEDTRQAIAERVALGIVTGQSQLETLQQIEALIVAAPEGDASIFGTIWNRAYVIQVTESGRAYSVAKRARGIQLNELFEGALMHRWADVGDSRTRPAHKEAGSRPPIPFKQRFVVDSGKNRCELLYPRDPAGKGSRQAVARNTIGCRCAEQQELPANGAVYDKPASSPADDVAQAIGKAESGVEKLMSSAGARLLPAHHGGARWPSNFLPSLRALLIRTPAPRPGPRPQHRSSATSWGAGDSESRRWAA